MMDQEISWPQEPFAIPIRSSPVPEDYKNGHYSIVASAILRPNSEYRVAVTTFNVKEAIKFRISIVGDGKTIKSEELTLNSNESQNVMLELGDIPKHDSYELVAKGLSGLEFEDTAKLKFDGKCCSVLIQTDKSMYKPGDTVRYRVLVLDRDFKPLTLEANEMMVFIRDSQGNRIKQWSKVALPISGVFEAELPLSTEPVMGNWNIHVEVAGQEQTKSFSVEQYVLPTYEVTVEAPGFTFINDELLKVVVCARYTYGKPVVGELTVSMKPKQQFRCWQSSSDDTPVCKQVVPIDGKKIVEFNLKELLKEDIYFRDVSVEAEVKESLTGRTLHGSTAVHIHDERYQISLIEESSYFPGLPYNAWIKVANMDGSPVQDATNPVQVSLRNPNISLWDETLTLDSNGMAKLNVNLDEIKCSHLQVEVVYLGKSHSVQGISKPEKHKKALMRVRSKEKVFTLGNELQFDVASTHPLKYLSYSLLARGELITSGAVDGVDSKTAVISLPYSNRMLPRAKLLVHYITTEGYLITNTTNVCFTNVYENQVRLTLSKEEAKPGEEIDVTVQTQKDSFVGLLAVDMSVLLLKSGNDLCRDKITEEWQSYESAPLAPYVWNDRNARDAESIGAILLSNRFIRVKPQLEVLRSVAFGSPMMGGAAPVAMKMACLARPAAGAAMAEIEPPVRANFPEAWIWESFSYSDEAQSIRKTVPDTITSWIITGFSLSKASGLGLTDQPSKMKVFLPFFLSIDLPYSVKLGETVRVPVIVFNYMEEDQEADVVFFNHQNEFEFVPEDTSEAQVYGEHHRRVNSTIASNSGKAFSFLVKPKKVGHITLKLTAKCALAGDAIERLLLVEPEGHPQHINKAVLIDLRTEKEVRQSFRVEIPDDAVPDSTKVEVSVIGDVLGSSIENLDSLIRMPFGCGEQNMLNFVPCIVVLDYLGACGRLSAEIESKAKKYMEVGYQRELTYKHSDGSFSAFGLSDKSGSTWLTAFVAKSFQQAAKYVTIDLAIIDRALEWLSNVQAKDGAFPEMGTIFHKDMQGGAGSGIALTAYTVSAFLEFAKSADFGKKYSQTVAKALAYINTHIKEQDDIYAYALAAYVLEKAHRVLTPAVPATGMEEAIALPAYDNEVMKRLEAKATILGDRKWWSKSKDVPAEMTERCWWNRPCSVDVEMSAYALLATLEANPGGLEGLPILKWLVAQRNDKGGFQSTQDTVVGLQALSNMAASLSGTAANISIKVKLPDRPEKAMSVNQDNVLVLQKYELPDATRELEMSAGGSGCALFQLSYKYHLKDVDSSPRFTLIPVAKRAASGATIELNISTSFIPQGDQSVSNMAVMEVDMPSGCVVENDEIQRLKLNKLIKKVETKRGDTTVVLYFDGMDENVVTLQLVAFQKHEIANAKPANVIIYDYYDNTRCARSFYEVAA
uniref:TEP1-F n=1 Tax=Anopheles atroparvus TaxID=41427 RepID=A0AAG5DFD2_ANOAO